MTPTKGPPKRRKAGRPKPRRRSRKRTPTSTRRAASKVLQRERTVHQTSGSQRLPRTRQNPKRHRGQVRRPTPTVVPRRRQKPKLRHLSPEQRRAVDGLLMRVYQHAARELADLEAQQARAAEIVDERMAGRFGTAREELMRALADWERRQGPAKP